MTHRPLRDLAGLRRHEWLTLAALFAVGLVLGWLDATSLVELF